MGTRVRAMINEANKLKVMVITISPNNSPAIPGTKSTGKNTPIVVRVEAVMAIPTSEAPLLADSARGVPISR